MTDEDIRAICEEWARGEHFPVDELDEQHLAAAMSAEPERWWDVLRRVIEDSPSPAFGENLSWVLALLVKVRGRAWAPVLVGEAGASRKVLAVVADAFWSLQFDDGEARIDPLRAYELFGRDVVVSTWLRHMCEGADSDWDYWPYNLVRELVEREPEEAWITITTMIEEAPLDHAELLGAGFLEDLLGGPLGDAWTDRIEELAGRSDNFRAALAHLWIDGQVAPETFRRIERAAGTELARRSRTSE